ncbi:elongation of very long chain fatty acids protein AAEL008004-like isoform X2 [Aricia agestis]|nr:elongation of very long chain fatty acids protein AAEL008004-like isoform X2 [Aricia agestis]
MKNRQPFELNTAIKLHNFSQVLLSLYMFNMVVWRIFFTDYSLTCQQTDIDDKYFDIECKTCYIYLIAKITELMDTVFFILRKSFRQVTFLHLFHHTIMPVGCWIGILYNPGGNAAVLGLFNTAVHVVMYSYYLLANFGDKYKKYLWWKKYVTVFQLVQFAIVGVHAFNSLFYSCGYPTILKLLVLTQSVFFFKMFGDFYVKTYWNKQPKKQANGVHENGKESNGVYKNGKESSNGIYENGKESSNGVYKNGNESYNGIYTNGKNKTQ